MTPGVAAPPIVTPLRRFWSAFAESTTAVASLTVVVAVVLAAILAPWISPQDPYDLVHLDLMDGRLPPGEVGSGGYAHVFGTDEQGRDLLSAILYGLRISIGVGVASGAIALLIGTTVGLTAAYFGGVFETVAMRIVDFQLSFPAVLLALILISILGKGIDKVVIALVAIQWAYFARTVRSQALVERRKDYMEAAASLALGSRRLLFNHLLPNCLPPLIVVATVQIASAIALEATLSFLGLGLPVTEPSLGMLIANGYEYVLNDRYWLSVYPGIALLITIGSINLVGDQLRDVLNPRLER